MNNIHELASNPSNWQKIRSYAESSENFTYTQMKLLFAKRHSNSNPELKRCFKLVGKTGYVNVPIFGLWMADLIPSENKGRASI